MLMNKPLLIIFEIVESAKQNDQITNKTDLSNKIGFRWFNYFTGRHSSTYRLLLCEDACALGLFLKGKTPGAMTICWAEYDAAAKRNPDEFELALQAIESYHEKFKGAKK